MDISYYKMLVIADGKQGKITPGACCCCSCCCCFSIGVATGAGSTANPGGGDSNAGGGGVGEALGQAAGNITGLG